MPISPTSVEGIAFNSQAEKKIYEIASESNYFQVQDRHLFYSLEITETGNRKRATEADFVYLDENYLLFLEVKGGQVKYDSLTNDWWVMDGTKKQDPFRQAKDIWFQVVDHLLPDLFKSRSVSMRLMSGYGVLFPDAIKPGELVNGNRNSIEYHSDLIYDFNDYQKKDGFIRYLNRLKEFWSNHPAYKSRKNRGISAKERITISKYFRQDLLFRLPTTHLLAKEKDEIKHLTNLQTYILDNIRINEKFGAIVEGGPGTGKTILASELANIKSDAGQKVLFLCYNRNLADYLSATLHMPNCKIVNLHSLYFELNGNKEPIKTEDKSDYEFYHEEYPLYVKNLLKESEFQTYDYLVIDEGQDIFNEYHFDVLDLLLENGWDSGNWSIFMDREYQNIYNKNRKYFDFFISVVPCFRNKLKLNCRNTPSAVNIAHLTTGFPKIETLRQNEYYKTEIRYGKSMKDIYNQICSELVNNPDIVAETTILCFTNSQTDYLIGKNSKWTKYSYEIRDKLTITTVHGFKGLEKPFVFLIGPDYFDPGNRNQMSLLYVGITRATTKAIVFFEEKNKQAIVEYTMKLILK